ncbi:MAG: hypothetical protein HQL08_05540 [Nitrospirae bacterium]|nr:hypothetical protein [Nitrospirota bacterium]
MLTLFNTMGRKFEPFAQRRNKTVTMFTCGPSVYQRSHIGNFRTFIFEDILVRYLEYLGYTVRRGMNFTDVEDKAVAEAGLQGTTLKKLAEKNIKIFLKEMGLLAMKIPDFLPKASESVEEAVEIIRHLIKHSVAYWYRGNVYFDPLSFPEFGKLYGLDMKRWPRKKKRFHKDTYPGIQWNLGDFVLWHGGKEGDSVYWDTKIGKGRPSWNIQDPGMVVRCFRETLSFFCGGIDNLYRHHDYNLAILESLRDYPGCRFQPASRYWLHCHHLRINGQKMSKSKGNIHYIETLQALGYTPREMRFFLIYGHYRRTLNYSDQAIRAAVEKLRHVTRVIAALERKGLRHKPAPCVISRTILADFGEHMDEDLNVRQSFDGIYNSVMHASVSSVGPGEAVAIVNALKRTDEVLKVLF